MRILIVQESDWLKRNNHQQHHLAELMSLRGHEIRVIDYEIMWRQGKKEFKSNREVIENVKKIYDGAKVAVVRPSIIKLPILNYVSLWFSHKKEIEQQVKEFNPDVVIGFGILNSYLAMRACKKAHIPFIYYWIDELHELISLAPLRILGKILESTTLRNSNKVIVINQKLKDIVTDMGAKDVEVLGAGIDTKLFNVNVNGGSIRKKLGFNLGDIVLFFMGWLYYFSGLAEVMIEMSEIRNTKIKLMIVGDGEGYVHLTQLRDMLKLRDNVLLLGKKPYREIPYYIAASDICILPAQNNRIMRNIVPIKMYEYMAMGKPVITTCLSGIMREFGNNSGVSYVYSPESVVQKAFDIVGLGLVNINGERARNFVKDNSWGKITEKFESIIRSEVELSERV